MLGGARWVFGLGREHLRGYVSAWSSVVGCCPGLGAPGGGGVRTRGITPFGTPSGRGTWGGLLAK